MVATLCDFIFFDFVFANGWMGSDLYHLTAQAPTIPPEGKLEKTRC